MLLHDQKGAAVLLLASSGTSAGRDRLVIHYAE